ncbi:hypothetical protein VTN00DRAFT_6475 [Thermoascus crustaceus]|uniref:uncharacterized protein n=1 Tax=Thermoascus crustaceus TaxID=5088 RepID=UPI0037446709
MSTPSSNGTADAGNVKHPGCRRTLKRDRKGHAFPGSVPRLLTGRLIFPVDKSAQLCPAIHGIGSLPPQKKVRTVVTAGRPVSSVYMILSILQHQMQQIAFPRKQRHTMHHRQSIPMLSRICMHEPRYRARFVRFVRRRSWQIAHGPPESGSGGPSGRRVSGPLPLILSCRFVSVHYQVPHNIINTVLMLLISVLYPVTILETKQSPSDICADMAGISPLSA